MLDLVMYSAGGGSWMTAKRVAERHGTANLRLLFTDTLYESADTYRFLILSAAQIYGVGLPAGTVPSLADFPAFRDRAAYKAFLVALRERVSPLIPGLTWIADGRDIWDVFRAERFLGNSGVDPCSKILKRQMADRWMKENCVKEDTRVYVGIDWTETHRFDDGEGHGVRPRRALDGWTYLAPMIEQPWIWRPDIVEAMKQAKLPIPMSYTMGFGHNNCFAGDTRFVTDEGVRTLREMAGKTCRVLSEGGEMTEATVRSFGRQPLVRLHLSRQGAAKALDCTLDHRWFTSTEDGDGRIELTTRDLKPGTPLASMFAKGTPQFDRKVETACWTVERIEDLGLVEEVFCAVVPGPGIFTLEDDLLTGNCKNFCIKAGHSHYINLITKDREHYLYLEEEEQSLREFLGADVSVLTDRTGDGKKKVLTLREFRIRYESRPQLGFDFMEENIDFLRQYEPIKEGDGGCGCMLESDEDDWTRALDERLAELVAEKGLADNALKAIADDLGLTSEKVSQRIRTLNLAASDSAADEHWATGEHRSLQPAE